MPQPPLVTIITPSFNQGRFLRRTIDSVLRQTYPHIEYLVLDGGSTDDSVAILRSYGQRFRWVSEPDHGQSHALNKGLARASGAILAYLNSDDVLLPRAVETVVRAFEAQPSWDVVYGRAALIDADDRHLGYYRTLPFTLQRLVDSCCIAQPAAFWRARLGQRIGVFNAQLRYCMDYEYWLRAAQSGAHLQYIEDLLASARLHADAKTSSCRAAIYRESIAVCRQQLGAAPRGPFIGLWQLWAEARCPRWPWLPRLLGTLQHRWHRLGTKKKPGVTLGV